MHKSSILPGVALVLAAPALAQTKPAANTRAEDKATYITAEEIAKVEKAVPVGDRTLKVVGIGHENFAVGIVHRGKTVNGRSEQRHVHGNRYLVRVSASLDGVPFEAGRTPPKDPTHEDAYVAVRDAFEALRRQLEDHRTRRDATRRAMPVAMSLFH